ncbi:MAG: phosphoadenosine phosphosulfate reductase [Sulfitobacter sp.]|nr:phosphoadenosine phosphosulfate reductase [Sulfitobacter sp.]
MIVSFGAGVQSTALLVLAARGEIPHRTFVFANVGEHAEHPDTLDYYRRHHRPFAEANGIELVETWWTDRKGKRRDLYDDLVNGSDRSIPIPVRWSTGAFGHRQCTVRYKIEVVNRWMRARGATKETPATVGIGFSTDEIERARTPGVDPRHPERVVEYPLLDLGLSRADCYSVIAGAGLPTPGRSACWFCPYLPTAAWRETRSTRPDLWEKAIALEEMLTARSLALGRTEVFLHGTLPLHQAVDDQLMIPGFDCGAGGCDT